MCFKIWNNNGNRKSPSKRKVFETSSISSYLKQVPSSTITPNTKSCKQIWKNRTNDHARNVAIGSLEERHDDDGAVLCKLFLQKRLRQSDSESTDDSISQSKKITRAQETVIGNVPPAEVTINMTNPVHSESDSKAPETKSAAKISYFAMIFREYTDCGDIVD